MLVRMPRFLMLFLLLAVPFCAAAADFERDLFFGLRNDPDVITLQEFLRAHGYFAYPQSTGNYSILTRQAVRQFQESNGISPVSGYFGPKSRTAANSILGLGGGPVSSAATTSSYKGKIVIYDFYGTASKPGGERLTLKNMTKSEKISVTGFRVENARGGSFTLPLAHALPGVSPTMSDPIVLAPGGRVVISLGKQERQINFRENLCTGYFDEFSEFSPSLDHQCPEIVLPNKASYTDKCIHLIESTGSCQAGKTEQFTDSQCATFINEHLNYNGCVHDNKNLNGFYLKRWLVWMRHDQEFFRNLTETVTVRDQNGRAVDERTY